MTHSKISAELAKRTNPSTPPEGWEARDAAVKAQRAKVLAEQQADEDFHLRRRLVDWGIPVKDVERVVLSTLKDTKPYEEAKRFEGNTDPDKCILVLAGSVGCGKTTAAAWWLSQPGPKSVYLKTVDPLFIPTFRLERLSRYSDKDMYRVEKARRLVVDDIGTEFTDSKGNFLTLLRGIVDARYADRLPLLTTTNLNADQFVERYGDRTISRLREVGVFREIKAKDLRRTK